MSNLPISANGTIIDGSIKLDEPLQLENGIRVRLTVESIDNGGRKLGTMRGSVLYIAPDFDAPLDDFREYM